MKELAGKRIAVIGAGKMGETLVSGLLQAGYLDREQVVATAAHQERLDHLEDKLGVATTLDNRSAAQGADVILLGVKPQTARPVLAQIGDLLTTDQLLISVLAGVKTTALEDMLTGDVALVRVMPNTPSLIGSGMSAICGGRLATSEHLEVAEAMFRPLGRSLRLDEKHFDAVTGLSASGPAFIYVVIEALAEGGVKVGLPRSTAIELAAQTCLGAAGMVLETGNHPALLKDEVTTPAGCTVDGLLKLEEGGLRVTLIKAVVEATSRAGELVDPD